MPENVQDRILAICRECLTENDVALISYNTYPGWHLRESVRDMMRYRVRQFDDLKVQVTQARALLTSSSSRPIWRRPHTGCTSRAS